MTTDRVERRLLQIIVVMLVSAAAAATDGAAPAADPWGKVPPLPTGCYLSKDDFAEKITGARDAMTAEMDRQERANSEITNQLNAMDAAEKMRRMQEAMMKDPQNAMKLMQQNQSAGENYTTTLVQAAEKQNQLAAELVDLQARYDAAVAAASVPFEAKFKDLDTRAQKSLVVVGESMDYAPWAIAEWNGINVQRNAAYERVCHEWWGASGPFHGWLKRFRDLQVQDVVPAREAADNAGVGIMTLLGDNPKASFRSTAAMAATREYMDQANNIFKKRRLEPTKPR